MTAEEREAAIMALRKKLGKKDPDLAYFARCKRRISFHREATPAECEAYAIPPGTRVCVALTRSGLARFWGVHEEMDYEANGTVSIGEFVERESV